MTHLAIENHIFLYRVADATGLRVDAYRDSLAQVRNAMLQTVFAEEDDVVFVARLGELRAAFAEHVHALERDLLPLVAMRLGPGEMESLGERMQAFWDATVGPEAGIPEGTHVYAAE